MKELLQEKTITLTLIGWDSWDRPVYKSMNGRLYVDVDPRADFAPSIHTKCDNEFDGEPDWPIDSSVEVEFVPARATW